MANITKANLHYCKGDLRVVMGTFLLVLATVVAGKAQNSEWMQMISPGLGWVATTTSVMWTTDNGEHWRNITPPSQKTVCSVFFLDASKGWVLLSQAGEPEPAYDLAFTEDSGSTWSVAHLNIPVDPKEYVLDYQGEIQFTDTQHGWMNLPVQSGSAFAFGLLFRTADGGKTWVWTPGPGRYGHFRFVDEQNGWVVGLEDTELWATHDGAQTWNKVVFTAPAGISPSDIPRYQLPVFSDSKHGAIAVNFHPPLSQDHNGSRMSALFTTGDGGNSWRLDRVLPQQVAYTSNFKLAFTDSAIIAAQLRNDELASIVIPTDSKNRVTTSLFAVGNAGAILGLSFANQQQGWIATTVGNCPIGTGGCVKVLSTANAGIKWKDIAPAREQSDQPLPPSKPIPLIWQPRQPPEMTPGNKVSIRLSFDKCEYFPEDAMLTMWQHWGYQDVGVYIGGSSHLCAEPDQTWVQDELNAGWGIVPIWVGLQSPCACDPNIRTCGTKCCPYPQLMSLNASTARGQGAAEAVDAVAKAQTLGLGGQILYLDLETYDPAGQNGTCGTAGSAFVDGWVSQLRNYNHSLAGVYSSPTDAPTWTENVPDDMWFNKWDFRYTIWGMNYGSDDTLWPNDQRLHQLAGDVIISVNGEEYKIDKSVEDATIVTQGMSKNVSVTRSILDDVSCQTSLVGVNNYLSVTGVFATSTDFSGLIGFNWNQGQGSYYWQPVSTAGWMSSLNNQCKGAACGFAAAFANTAVGVEPATPCSRNNKTGNVNCGPDYGIVDKQNLTPTSFKCSQAFGTDIIGVSDDPQYAGNWYDSNGLFHGFVSPDTSGQQCRTFDPTGSIGTYVSGINGDGQVVGTFLDSNGTPHGFIYNYGNGVSPPVPVPYDYPQSTGTYFYGINNNGVILGYAWLASGDTYFLYDENNGSLAIIPTGYPTDGISGLNDLTTLVGANRSSNTCVDGLVFNSGLVP